MSMRDVTGARGLADLRTATISHIHSKPPQKGTAHLDLYLLGKEKQRLEKELARLGQSQRRSRERVAEIRQTIGKLEEEAKQENSPQNTSTSPGTGEYQPAPANQNHARRWKKMTVDY
jgi:hypothetical protein